MINISYHPINLAIRFALELIALASVGFWGWQQSDGWRKFLLAVGIPALLATIWGVFAVPNDPSRSGSAPFPVHGIIRLILELGFFAFATWALQDMDFIKMSLALGITTLVHYIVSYDRILWLISGK